MAIDGSPRQGLRERKKLKLRRTVQLEALRLFDIQGYERTTVEQIAEAAEVSTTTFYRYFPTKEDLVLDDDYEPVLETNMTSSPADESLSVVIRAATAVIAAAAEADRSYNLSRLRLVATVPALATRYAGEEHRKANLMARLVADRSGLRPDSYQVELTAAAVVAVLFAATRRWAAEEMPDTLGTLYEDAITTVEPLLMALDKRSHALRKSAR